MTDNAKLIAVLEGLKEWVEKYPVVIRYNSPSKVYDKIYKVEINNELDRLIDLHKKETNDTK